MVLGAWWKIDRHRIFLCPLFFLFLFDLAYILGVRDPERISHPFVLFRVLGDWEFLRNFAFMLRYFIFVSVAGGLMGFGLGFFILTNTMLTGALLSFLRHGLWIPFFPLYGGLDPFTLSLAAATLCACYHCLTGISDLGLRNREAEMYVARETMLQVFFISLLSQFLWPWSEQWRWAEFAVRIAPASGVGVLITVLICLFFINWVFRYDFNLDAERRRTILDKDLGINKGKLLFGLPVFAVTLLIIWQTLGFRFHPIESSPQMVVIAAYDLLTQHGIYRDIWVSLSELLGGLILGIGIAVLLEKALSATKGAIKNALFVGLPGLYISPILLWLFVWLITHWVKLPPAFVEYWHKVILVGFLTFFTLTQTLWALRDRPLIGRLILAVYDALPIAFVTMLFGQLFASTSGIGFAMTVASATYQIDRGLALFLITVVLFAGMSATLGSIAKRLLANGAGRQSDLHLGRT